MTIDRVITSQTAQQISLLILRVTTGFLLVWVGLDKLINQKAPSLMRRSFELSDAVQSALGVGAGLAELAIGVCVVIGLWRRIVFPLQAAINAITAASVWWAIVDPYRWYIEGVDRIVFNSHVFYPTSITFAACVLLVVFRPFDRLALDEVLRRPRA